jgi:hypothetical protein
MTIAADLEKLFESSRALVNSDLKDSLTLIHISFDLWTSPNHIAMIAIFGHFIDRNLEYQDRLLALRQQQGTHSGENIAYTVEQVLREWGIEERVGATITDNATNNDACLGSLYPRLSPRFSEADIKHRRLRCFGHILNLVAKAFLYGNEPDIFEADIPEQQYQEQEQQGQEQEQQSLDYWRKRGPVGKLHNTVKFIRSSPQRIEAFRKIARDVDDASGPDGFSLSEASKLELELKQNNSTRWNSTYLMIKRAWEKQSHIQAYINALEYNSPPSGRVPYEGLTRIGGY